MTKSWKDYILRSGAPLEYEVARSVSNNGFEIDADFCYMRRDVDGAKEMSVDILAVHWGNPEELQYAAHLLIECKYRAMGKSLLLLPEPNVETSPATVGGTVMCLDQFVPYHLAYNAFLEMEMRAPLVYKGVEILAGGESDEREFRKGIQQLRYGMPAALHRAIDLCFFGAAESLHSIFLAPILVTNAPLLVLKEDVDMRAIAEATDISDITTSTGMAVLYSGHGPDYEQHFHGTLANLLKGNIRLARDLEKDLRKQGKKFPAWNGPSQTIRDLRGDDVLWSRKAGSQFYVVNLDYLDVFLVRFLAGCRNGYDLRRKKSPRVVAEIEDFLFVDSCKRREQD